VQLKRGRCQISDLDTGFKTGVALCILCEQISGEKLRKYNKKPKMEIHMLENLNIALKWLHTKVRLVGIGSRGLYEGETKQTLGLLWTLILRFQVQEVEIDGLSGKKGLLVWCRRNIQDVDPDKKVGNFTNAWKDGKAFCALTAKFRPDLIDYGSDEIQSMSGPDRLRHIFGLAEKELDIPQLLDVDDMEEPDEKVVMMYVAEYFKCFSQMIKAGAMIKGIKTAVDVTMRHDKYISDYEESCEDLSGWMEGKQYEMGESSSLGVNEDEVQERMQQFYAYCSEEKLERKSQLYALKGSLAALHNSQAHNKRPAYAPAEGMDPESLEAQLNQLVSLETAYETRLTETYKLFRKYRLIFVRIAAKAQQIEDWAEGRRVALAQSEAQMADLGSQRPATQLVMLTEEADFLTKFRHELDQFAPVVAQIGTLAGQIAPPSELVAQSQELVAGASRTAEEFAREIEERSQTNAARAETAGAMKSVLSDYGRRGDQLLFDIAAAAERVREPCVEDGVAAVEAHLAEVQRWSEEQNAALAARLDEMRPLEAELGGNGFGDLVRQSPQAVAKLEQALAQLSADGQDSVDELRGRLASEREKEAARVAFADAANALKTTLDGHAAKMSGGDASRPLSEQMEALEALRQDFAAEADALSQLAALHETCDALKIVVNAHTPETYHSLVAQHGEIAKAFDRVAADIQAGMDADQKLSPEQLQELRKVFNAFDEDRDGALKPEEFHSATTGMGMVLNKKDVEKKFRQVNTDGTGAISFEEFVKMMEEELLHSSSKADVLEAFRALSGGDKKACTEEQVAQHFSQPHLGYISDAMAFGEDGKGDFVAFTEKLFSR
jgi:actinin alpha